MHRACGADDHGKEVEYVFLVSSTDGPPGRISRRGSVRLGSQTTQGNFCMSSLMARSATLFMLLLIVGLDDTTQRVWAQEEEALDDMAMAKACRRANDPQCARACLNAVKGYVGSDQCRAAYNAMKARQPEPAIGQTVNEHPVLERERWLLEREPETRAQLEEERRRIKPGLVYKTSSFWEKKLLGDDSSGFMAQSDKRTVLLKVIKDTFDGTFYTKESKSWDFPLLYRGFARSYGEGCFNYLQDPIEVTEKLITRKRFGPDEVDEGKPYPMEGSFYEKFDAYTAVESAYAMNAMSALAASGASVGEMLGPLYVHKDTMDAIVANIPCTSATMRQLRMNVWLRAHDQPSLQDAGEAIPGAAEESEIHILEAKIAEFESMMAAVRNAANRTESYSIIDPPARIGGEQGIEIAYFYNYYAKSNWTFESHLRNWLQQKDAGIQFVRIPAASSSDRMSAYGYYAAQNLGQAETIHNAIFDAIYVTRRAPAAYQLMGDLFEKQGVDANAFDEAMRSSSVKESVAKAETLHSRYSITDLPVFLVNGKYEVSTATCRCGPEEMLKIATDLAQRLE